MNKKQRDNRDHIIRNSSGSLPRILLYATSDKSDQKSMLGKEWFKKTLEGKTVRFPNCYKDLGLKSAYERMDAYKALLQSSAEAQADSTWAAGTPGIPK